MLRSAASLTPWRAWLSLCAVGLFLAAAAPGQAQDRSIEQAVKATYLYKFAPFVEWPDGAFAAPASPLVLCVIGEESFARLIARAARGQTAHGRAFSVRHLPRASRESACHIIYLSASAAQPLDEALQAVRGRPVLTVTDAQREGGPRSVIEFVLRDNRVQFAIDDQAAAANGLRISSKLLSLATSVNPRRG